MIMVRVGLLAKLAAILVAGSLVTAGHLHAQSAQSELEEQKVAEFMRLSELWRKTNDFEQKIAAVKGLLRLEPELRQLPVQASREQVKCGLLITLGDSYEQRRRGERADNLERAIETDEAALAVCKRETLPEKWAQTQNNLAVAYAQRIRGVRVDNLEKAIEANESALTVYTRQAFPWDWAVTKHDLGVIYAQRIRGVRADNLEKAIEALEAALTIFTRQGYTDDWARTQASLGNAYRARIRGVRRDNIEMAITAFESALSNRTRSAVPEEWATTQNNLANAYGDRIKGERADNLERAIAAYEAALTVRTRPSFPEEWAQIQYNLANTYTERIHGERADNLEKAIAAYKESLTVRTRTSFPEQWAFTQNNLASAYTAAYAYPIRGNRADNLEKAIQGANAALTVLTREAFPEQWGVVQRNLAEAYTFRIRGVRAENLEEAIAASERALTIFKRDTFPEQWAATQNDLGNVYRERIAGARADNLERAINAYQAALTVYLRETSPREHLRTARAFGETLLLKRDWHSAAAVYASAREAFLQLFGLGLDEAAVHDLLLLAGPLFADAAYAAVEMGDLEAATSLLNEGKARLLAVALRQQSLDLSQEKQERRAMLKAEIHEWSRAAETSKGIEHADALQHLGALQDEFSGLLREAFGKDAAAGVTMESVRQVIPEGGAIVVPIITEAGGKMLIIVAGRDRPSITVLDLPNLTGKRLDKLLRGDDKDGAGDSWLGAYGIQYLPRQEQTARINEWRAAIEGIGGNIWTLFAGPLDAELQRLGMKPGSRLIWLPAGGLGLLPLGLAQEPPSGRRFVDIFEIAYAPSLEALGSASRQLAQAPMASLAAVVNPTGNIPELNLRFTEIEGALVASHFASNLATRLDKSDATPEAVLAALKGKSYWHFSSHGVFNWNDARQAGLLMKDGAPLTVGVLLEEGDLGRPRLIVMSACESGLFDTNRSPDEFVGLPATFMRLGAAGVLSTLWQVDDLATALLVAKFYDLHLDQKLTPAAALRQAQVWLRGASKADLIAFGQDAASRAKLDPSKLTDLEASLKSRRRSVRSRGAFWNMLQGLPANVRRQFQSHPFAHPYYWGGFVYSGV
jgi:CHAT domain-containing protein/tetratricopeptide (TPR) repeat protein